MMLVYKLKELYLDVQFHFGGYKSFLAILINPFYFIRKNLYYNIVELLPHLDGKVMDFGCGASPYKKFFVNCKEYVGVDIEESGHSHNNENIDVFYDGKVLPFPDECFDGVFSSEVFEHIFNLEDIIKELNRVLKPNGKMIITVPFVWNEHEIPYDFARYTSYGIKSLLERNGFEVIHLRKSTLYFEALVQMWIEFLRNIFNSLSTNFYFNIICQIIFIAPFTIIGCFLCILLPKNESLFSDIVLVCRKK